MKKSAVCKNFLGPILKDALPSGADVMLEKAIVSLQNNQPVATTFESLYNSVADLLQPQFARFLCQKLELLMDGHTRAVLDQFKQNDLEQMHFLRKMNDCWKTHCHQLAMIRGIFLFLDRKYVLSDKSVMSIWELGIEKFRNHLSINTVIQKRTVEELLDLIGQERHGIIIDRTLVKDLLGMMSSLSIYSTIFEPRFFEETQLLYRTESQRIINEQEVPEYLKYVNRIIHEETQRSMCYLESLTQVPLIETVERELIAAHLTLMLTKGLDQLLDDMRLPDLILLHTLLSRVTNGLQELCAHFKKHIKQRGLVIVTNVDRDKTMVCDLLDFKERMDRVVNECFQKQEKFVYALKEAFEHFINQRQNKPAELIAKYIDQKLKSGYKGSTEDELERMLDQILVLFRFIHGKDVFEAFYKKDLAKRLLVNKSASVDAEKSMLSRLKQECGAGFTSKLEGMFKDIETSMDMMTSFKNHMSNHSMESPIDLYVNVLTMGFWPTYQPMEVKLPQFLLKHQNTFEKFYNSKHNGRKLQWQPNLGFCVLSATYPSEPDSQGSKHEFLVSLFQTIVLLLFNDKDEYDYTDLLAMTKIEQIELKRTLQSLACGKARVLIKEPRGKEVNDTDKFFINIKFKHPLFKVKINQVQLKETHEEQSMTEERVFQDRQYQIDAAIVRIMKTRKKLCHTALVAEVFEHVRFPVKAHDVKVRVESLIERDYLHRDPEKANSYNYVA